MFLTKRLERCLCRSDFGKGTWITLGLEAVFSRNMRKNTCSLVGGLISFDYSSQEGRRTSYPKLIWGMSFKKSSSSRTVETSNWLDTPDVWPGFTEAMIETIAPPEGGMVPSAQDTMFPLGVQRGLRHSDPEHARLG